MAWDKTKPLGSAPVNIGDDKIRINFDHLEDSLAREHQFPTTYNEDSGRHKFIIASDNRDLVLIPGQVNGMLVGRDDVAALMQRQDGSWVGLVGCTYGTIAERTALTVTPTDIPAGYAWVDSDNDQHPLWVWTGSAWSAASVEEGYEPGDIKVVSYGTTPTGWLYCDGGEYAEATYPDLYLVIANVFDTGGETPGYFRVPDLSGRTVFGKNSIDPDFASIGTSGGTVTHNHSSPITTDPSGNDPFGVDTDDNNEVDELAHTHDVTVPDADNLPPYLTLRYLIKT